MERKEKDFDKMWDEIESKISEVSRMVESLKDEAEEFEKETSKKVARQEFAEVAGDMLDICADTFISDTFKNMGITKMTIERTTNRHGNDALVGTFEDENGDRVVGIDFELETEEDDECDCDCGCNCDACECDEDEEFARKEAFVEFLHNFTEMLEASLYDQNEEEDNGKSRKGKHSK